MVIYYWELQTPDKLIFYMIKGGGGGGGGGGGSDGFFHIGNTDIFRLKISYCDSANFFPNPILQPFFFKPSHLEKANIFRHFPSNVKRK